jgi:hypothetical protein
MSMTILIDASGGYHSDQVLSKSDHEAAVARLKHLESTP